MRWVLAGLLAAALAAAFAPADASAQRMRDFEDSWFWGVKGGVTTFAPTFGESETSATLGAEWLITRRQGALYAAIDQANVSTESFVFDPSFEGDFRPVGVEKLRRVSVAALAFPRAFGRFRPYGGLGFAVNVIGDAYPLVAAEDEQVDELVYDRIDDRSTQIGVLLMAGGQLQVRKLAIFAQASVVPSNDRFLLDRRSLGFFEGGLRYNFGTSREGLK